MPLSTNRLYTHETVPSNLSIDLLPTRMGYVVRCSSKSAQYHPEQNKTFIVENDKTVEMTEPKAGDIKRLKDLYLEENLTDKKIKYEGFYFSLNKGDYLKPIV